MPLFGQEGGMYQKQRPARSVPSLIGNLVHVESEYSYLLVPLHSGGIILCGASCNCVSTQTTANVGSEAVVRYQSVDSIQERL